MEFKKLANGLDHSQYYPAVYQKKYIFLHHTAGPSAQSAVDWWDSKPDHVATPFIIERNGDIIELYDPKYWAYALGIKGGTAIEKASIQIELVSWGKLTQKDGKYYAFGTLPVEVPASDVITFKNFYRECYHYQRYTDAQIKSLKELLPYLVKEFGIEVQKSLENFWYFNKALLTELPTGIWSHSSVRPDKSDIMPQKELITMLYNLKFG